MAGGYGFTVEAPMEIPQDPGPQYLRDDLPEVVNPGELPIASLSDISTSLLRAKSKALPPMKAIESLDRGRQQEAAETMYATGVAFATSKAQERYQRAKAKARGRQAEQMAKQFGRR